MKKNLLFIILHLLLLSLSAQYKASEQFKIVATKFKKDTFNILQFNAVGDGIILNTKSIQATIDACSKKGGGVVYIPNGLFLTGPLVLKSNVNLHLAPGSVLLFTKDLSQYPLVEGNWEGLPQMRNQSPLSARNATNIAITGKGVIDGNGEAWRMVKKDKLTDSQWKKLISNGGIVDEKLKIWYPTISSYNGAKAGANPGLISSDKDEQYYQSIKDFLRPNLIVLENCFSVLIDGVTLQNSPAWCLHPLMSSNIIIKNVIIKNPWYAQNGDGIDLESCQNVTIDNCVLDVGDDALCMKSGRDEVGRRRGMPTRNVSIKNCIVYAAHGGFVIGSEMSGGINNIWVDNCTFIGTDIGLRFKSARGRGGVVENINISNIYMKDIVGEAILFDMYYMAKDPIPLEGEKRELPVAEFKRVDETTPIFRKFNIKNVYVNGAEKALFIRGLPEMPVQQIAIENFSAISKLGLDLQEAAYLNFKNVQILSQATNPVVNITQSSNLLFQNFIYPKNAELVFALNGERVKQISCKQTTASTSNKFVKFFQGAKENEFYQ